MDGNPRAAARLTSLYEAHAADAFRYAFHLTGRREDAEDVVQHVFLQAYALLEGGRALVNPRAWLIKATKHRSLNLIRDRRDAPSAEIDPPAPFGPGEDESEALAEVRAALWSLPEPQHHAFVLRHWSGLSQDEIADVLATTPGAVESLLVRARATLAADREDGHPECVSLRGRLAQMLSPTHEQAAHLAACRRCRTAQTRLLRAAEFATAFALVPSPHVLHALTAAIPGFGATGAAASAAATGAAATGSGGAAVSTVSVATKAGILTKAALVATTAAVAVTAAHPLRSAVTHAIFRHAPAALKVSAPKRAASHAAASATAGSHAVTAVRGSARPAPGRNDGRSGPTGRGAGAAAGAASGPPGKTGGGAGKSGTAGTNGNGSGGRGGASGGATNGKSGLAPGQTKAGGSAAGKGKANGATSGEGTKRNGGGAKPPTNTKTNPGRGATKTTTTGGEPANGNGNGNAGGADNGNGNGNAGAAANGKGSAGDADNGKGNGNA